MKKAIDLCAPRFNNLVFPLADLSIKDIDSIWINLPDEIKQNTFSTSRPIDWIKDNIRS
jgi:hypothetical protein